jgi:3-methyl-2-oxobutanoate hydroxymethyltransferase
MTMRKKPTVADLLAQKGKRQLTMLRVTTLDEAAAAEQAGIDFVSVPEEICCHPRYREVAPTLFSMTGRTHLEAGTRDDYLRWALGVMNRGADAVYCSGSAETVAHAAREYVPVIGHVGLVPARATWTGGFRAVGKTAQSALKLWNEVRALEDAGAIGAEIEVVPVEVAEAISRRTPLLMLSMGAGAGCDAQYLFTVDLLGETRGHIPRHSKVYRNFAAEYDRLQAERIAAFREYRADVEAGGFPEERHILRMDKAELDAFMAGLPQA